MTSKRWTKFAVGGALASIVGALLASVVAKSETSILSDVMSRVPRAQQVLAFQGSGFKATPRSGYVSDAAPAPGQPADRAIAVTAPRDANGSFRVRDGRGGERASIRLAGAVANQKSESERGVVTYRGAYPGVDVVAARDPERFELAYIADSDKLPVLEIDVGDGDGSRLRVEAQTGAAVLHAEDGRPKLRIDPPVAFDSQGQERKGSYVLADADTLRIALNVEGMVPPILVDPAFYIPFWTLVEDGRAPGGAAYDLERQARQSQIVLNGATGRPWLIRPSAPLDIADFEEPVGAERGEDWYSSISATPRAPGQNAPSPSNPLLDRDFQRTASRESETYEWRDNAWHLLPHAGLPGFFDPTLAFDASRGTMFAMGGHLHAVTAQTALTSASAIFQNDGNGWTAKGFPGAPPARTRAASASFGSKIVVFGGRSLTSQDLLNDTWTFDGVTWRQLPISNPPPACESSQLVHDTRRDRLVLVGGNCSFSRIEFQPSDADGFRLWEFDGTDWIRRFDIVDPTLPRSFQLRRSVAAAWHPIRRTTVLFGGFIDVAEHCPLTPEEVASKRQQANIAIFVSQDHTLELQLQSQGCWGGYAHDTWEWDGSTLRQLTSIAFGGSNPPRHFYELVFRQVSGAVPPPLAANDERSAALSTKLWPWRYDASPDHFAQRSALERSAARPGVANAPAVTGAGQGALAANPTTPPTMVSPMFAPHARPQMLVTPDTGKMLIFFSDDGQVYETDLTSWVDRTPQATPFAGGRNDFFAAAFDSARQLTVLFSPVDGVTWEHDSHGWRRIDVPSSPGIWNTVFTQPWWNDLHQASINATTWFPLRPPRMVFDRARARSVMLHRDALWEFDGASWAQFATPAALKNCKAATVMAFDGTRNKTIAVGCTVPGQTWEWDGGAWAGPFASPFKDQVVRPLYGYRGTLEMEYLHPNALFESASLGGVGIIDSAGTLRIWKGSGEWEAGPYAGDPDDTQAYDNYSLGMSQAPSLPHAFYPPVIEDYSAACLLLFRDGIRATRELKLLPQPATSWEDSFVGNVVSGGTADRGIASVHPFPMELLPLDLVRPEVNSDPATSTNAGGTPMVITVGQQYRNLFWSLRFLPDPVAKRVHVLTHRGVFWELGSERVSDTGEACSSSKDCKDGSPCSQGVCCEQTCDGRCLTCNGVNPGKCEAMPAGSLDPQARCGAGECAGVCSGVTQFSNGFPFSNCSFTAGRSCGAPGNCSDGQITGGSLCSTTGPTCVTAPPTPRFCGGGLECADAGSCKPACTSPSDCAAPHQICSPDGKSCIPDGKLCHSDAECPKFNDCASDGMSCKPDAVLAAATARGTSPSAWQPELVRNPTQIATWLRGLGYPDDGHGRIILDTESTGPLRMVFDPQDVRPVTGFRYCMQRINQCRYETGKLDECVAAAPRCVSNSPSPNDPGGFDCCPESCLLRYFALRSTLSPADVMVEIADGSCYPHLLEDLGIQ